MPWSCGSAVRLGLTVQTLSSTCRHPVFFRHPLLLAVAERPRLRVRQALLDCSLDRRPPLSAQRNREHVVEVRALLHQVAEQLLGACAAALAAHRGAAPPAALQREYDSCKEQALGALLEVRAAPPPLRPQLQKCADARSRLSRAGVLVSPAFHLALAVGRPVMCMLPACSCSRSVSLFHHYAPLVHRHLLTGILLQ